MTPADHANTVRDAIWRAPGWLHQGSLAALDALVAQAETADPGGGWVRRSALTVTQQAREQAEARITELHASLERTNESYIAAEQAAEQARNALQQIAAYYEAEYQEGDKAYQAAILARAALAGNQTPEERYRDKGGVPGQPHA